MLFCRPGNGEEWRCRRASHVCGPSCLQGRQYPVEVMYTAAPEDSYVDAALTTVLQVCRRRVPPLAPLPCP